MKRPDMEDSSGQIRKGSHSCWRCQQKLEAHSEQDPHAVFRPGRRLVHMWSRPVSPQTGHIRPVMGGKGDLCERNV